MATKVYRFRIKIQERPFSIPLQLCVSQQQPPKLHQLIQKIQQFTQDLTVEDYAIMIDNHRDQGKNVLLADDCTLQNALSLLSDHDRLEIMLCRKESPVLSEPKDHLKDTNPLQPNSDVLADPMPIIKPFVLRWAADSTETRLPISTISHQESVQGIQSYEPNHLLDRKDSGISLDEPIRKKQRLVSTPSRKLPELSSPLIPHHSNSFIEHKSPMIHPLDIRRTSLSPPSPPLHTCMRGTSPGPSPAIVLPAISFITSVSEPLDLQLAPIHHSRSHDPTLSPARYPLSPPTSVSSPVSFAPLLPANAERPAVQTTNISLGQFVCDRVIDLATGRTCNQAFRRSYDLTRHQTTHLQDRPYRHCEQCGKKFTRLDALRRHERVQGHHPPKHTQSLSFHSTRLDEAVNRSQQARAR
ncbi:hypothetical protein CLU79DRAFT_758574 [Phycomyces nitens]|nr:hypothetical protein CLU79DRAFT_758574 [Phycomyces nitens]